MQSRQSCMLTLAVSLSIALGAIGCASPKGDTPQAKRDYALRMKDKALSNLYAQKPEAQADVEHAPGYATFDGISYGLGFFGGGGGYGVMTDNATKKVSYLSIGEFQPGFGIAGKGYKSVWVFEDADTYQKFAKEKGTWDTSADAEAAFKFGTFGGSAEAAGSFDKGVKIYEMTDGGIVLRVAIPITNVKPNKKLNEGAMDTPPAAAK